MDEVFIGRRSVFLIVQLGFQFGVFDLQCGHMAVAHLVLLLTAGTRQADNGNRT
jgi:hypothetical protein